MEKLESLNAIVIQQKKEWGEIITDFETKNRYAVFSPDGEELFFAAEEGGSFLLRWFLKALRPFKIRILDTQGKSVLSLHRPFRFYFHIVEIFDNQGKLVGTIKKQFSILRRIYSVNAPSEQEIYQLFGPLLHPWTFNIYQDDKEVGNITKKWSGLLKETFTDSDNFGITFPPGADTNQKSILLGAVFLIDFVHFENN